MPAYDEFVPGRKVCAAKPMTGRPVNVPLMLVVASPEHISKAMLLAMETDGVREVISTLQVKPGKG